MSIDLMLCRFPKRLYTRKNWLDLAQFWPINRATPIQIILNGFFAQIGFSCSKAFGGILKSLSMLISELIAGWWRHGDMAMLRHHGGHTLGNVDHCTGPVAACCKL